MSSNEKKNPNAPEAEETKVEETVSEASVNEPQQEEADTQTAETSVSPEMIQRIAKLQAQLSEAQQKAAEAQQKERDVALRARAEVENIRRRAELDVEKAHKFALEKFASELLPVIDNLERALTSANQDNPDVVALREGVELTLKSFLDAVRKFGIEVVDAVNIPFNPELHQAMTMMESPDHQPNHVIMVMQKGYLLNGRLIRPAMVAVSK